MTHPTPDEAVGRLGSAAARSEVAARALRMGELEAALVHAEYGEAAATGAREMIEDLIREKGTG